jgi:hypothetical protein
MQHSQQLVQFLERNSLRAEALLESILNLFETGASVQHFQDREFLFLESIVLESQGVFDDPVMPALVKLLLNGQIRAHPQAERSARPR